MQVFPETSLLTAEFDKILGLVSEKCVSVMGKEEVKKVTLHTDPETIDSLLKRTEEMKHIIASGLPFPSSGYIDVSRELSLLRIENSTLSEIQFAALHEMMKAVKEVYRFLDTRKLQFPNLNFIREGTEFEKAIMDEIESVIDENQQVRTSASAELARIRKSLQRNLADADRIFNSALSRYRKQGWLAEQEESSRNGRRVISVFSEQKRAVRGIIHDQSATGKTIFVEPEETIGINNTIATLEQEERQEIIRILRALAAVLRRYVPLMYVYREHLGIYDFNRAKALLAIDMEGKMPRVVSNPLIDLKQARHPLLFLHNRKINKPTIPFTLKLDHDNRILIISGPNAGGKTVCMKTSGLLQMMVQAGLLVSAHEDSEFGIFENIMVDIGDSQSIEYELSTYSSRLRHMRIFLQRINEKSLFLIDEFGTGTDPNLGGALAEAVLEELNNRKAIGIITTHYLNLKIMADKTEGMLNGSMEFDLKKLQPQFRLVIGKPGSSYTFLVAERSGLPPSLIKNARRKVARKNLMLEKLLTDVQKEKDQLKLKLSETSSHESRLKEQIKKSELSAKSLEDRLTHKEQRLKKLEEKLTRESEHKFRNFLREWKKSKNKKEVYDKYYRQFVRIKKTKSPEVIEKRKNEKLKIMKEVIRPGVQVKLENGNTRGVVEEVDNDKAYVIFGQFRTVCDLVNLVLAE